MKKIVLLSGLVLFSAAQASTGAAGKASLEGFYAGLGICWLHSDDELKVTDGVDAETQPAETLGGMKIHDKKADKVGGSLVAGYGAFVGGNFYLGGEVMVDFAGNKETKGQYVMKRDAGSQEYAYRSKVKGVVPSLAVRLGYWCCPIDSMVYLKAGVAYVQSEYQEFDFDDGQAVNAVNKNTRKMSKIVPLVGLGVEKNIYSHLNLRLEGDYRFRAQKTTKTEDEGDGVVAGVKSMQNIKQRLSGFSVRLMATYNF